ncbi:MAG: hypothetical protein ABI193_19105, partial [Minicystis sp.]
MNEPLSPRDRYAARARELDPRLAADQQPERVLTAAGDLLRRRAALGVDSHAVDEALLALESEAIAAWFATLPERIGQARFERAAEAAALVALAESPEDRAAARGKALEALR